MRLEFDVRDSSSRRFFLALGGFLRGRATGINDTCVLRFRESNFEPIVDNDSARTSSKSLAILII